MSIVEKLRQARNIEIEIDGVVFLAKRPTDLQAARWHSEKYNFCDMAADSVYGWRGFTGDMISSDLPKAEIPFDKELWSEWIVDNQEYWTPIAEKVLTAYSDFRKTKGEAAKN